MGSRGAKGGGQKKQTPIVPQAKTEPEEEVTVTTLAENPQKSESFDEMIGVVNPTFDYLMGDNRNCQTCVLAAELRNRGIDVVATPNVTGDRGFDAREDSDESFMWLLPESVKEEFDNHMRGTAWTWFKDPAKVTDVKKDILAEMPDGSRGFMRVKTQSGSRGGGHIVNFEVKNGQIIVYDNQTSSKMPLSTFMYGKERQIRRNYAGVGDRRWENVKTHRWYEVTWARIDDKEIYTDTDLAREYFKPREQYLREVGLL